ncbi:MAG: DinB family protein [Fimbriimonadaceae bacterium]|nr:DinB family protein [Fimbriimonadaceae bacterium]QYK56602.1 MAG: DinB family protein [Fimbriimonadaceae bacterium]
MDEPALVKELAVAWEYTHAHDEWVEPLERLLSGVTAEQAAERQRPDEPGIWEIVLHLATHNEDMVERVRTGRPTVKPQGDWPPLPSVKGEAEWGEAKARLVESVRALGEMIERTPLAQIQASPYGLADLLCRYTHMGYHLGQITKMRVWPDGW